MRACRPPRGRFALTAQLLAILASTILALVAGGVRTALAASSLYANQSLTDGQQITSPSGNVRLAMQSDGNLVLYTFTGGALWYNYPPLDYNPTIVWMQSDGNLVVYDIGTGKPVGQGSGTGGHPVNSGYHVSLLDSGDMVIYYPNGAVLKDFHTSEGPVDCYTGGQHWYTTATSGAGTTRGTGSWTTTPASSAVPGGNPGFANEAVWVRDNSNPDGLPDDSRNRAVEAGWMTGTTLNGTFFSDLHGYYTIQNGTSETDGPHINYSTQIWMGATHDGTYAYVNVNNWLPSPYYYPSLLYPHQNYSQAETNCHQIWMGGGGGESLQMYWLDGSGSNWNAWGQMANTADYPYWQQQNNLSNWSNGGYGYF
jgi:hypothetical protein